jgi:hypothetical protein
MPAREPEIARLPGCRKARPCTGTLDFEVPRHDLLPRAERI